MSNNNRTGPKQMPEIDINTLKNAQIVRAQLLYEL